MNGFSKDMKKKKKKKKDMRGRGGGGGGYVWGCLVTNESLRVPGQS